MATMIKEKRRDKKKTKSKNVAKKEEELVQLFEDKPISITASIICEQETNFPEEGTSEAVIETDDTDEKTTLIVEPYVEEVEEELKEKDEEEIEEKIEPSAPILQEQEVVSYPVLVEEVEVKPIVKVTPMPLEEAIRLFGGKEISEVRTISEQEEANVEAGPQTRPDHPLIDYLSTFRSSLKAVERERHRISAGYVEEEKSRANLWKVYKRTVNVSEKCSCGAPITFRATFDVANFDKERLPAARMRLESLLREVEESYCHHQHITLQTHYDVDELLYDILQTHKDNVKEALFLVFQAMKLSDGAPEAYSQALQRWACILSTSLLDQECDDALSYLLFFLHNIFRQTRSVQWAGSVLSLQVNDMSSAARLLGILEVILTRPVLESAQECTEGTWEELDDRGEGSAVGDGRLRERDLLNLLQALPLRNLLAKLTLFMRQDISEENNMYWGDHSGGHGVLKCTCGVRTLLHVLQRACTAHAHYAKLHKHVHVVAIAALNALAALHMHSRVSYTGELEEKIKVELEACFAAGFILLQDKAYKVPATLLEPKVVMDYCITLIASLHVNEPVKIEELDIIVQPQPCSVKARLICTAALQRENDQDLARTVLEFMFQTGIRRATACSLGCVEVVHELMPSLLTAHPRLHTIAFHLVAEIYNMETVEPSVLAALTPARWRPAAAEARALLAAWSAACAALLPHLLLQLDYEPTTGLSLETQLTIGHWVCSWAQPGETPEWAWQVMRLLRVHRAHWPVATPPPEPAPPLDPARSLLHTAFALLASEWGHSLPLICGPGVDALVRLCASRACEGAHVAAQLMRVMAQSPESVSLTPKFTEVFSVILSSGPSLVQRALGRRGSTGQDLLHRHVIAQMMDDNIPGHQLCALVSAWLHALWQPALPAAARAVLDAALRAARDWRTLDAHAHLILQEQNADEYILDAIKHSAVAPLLCEGVLRAAHAGPAHARALPRLLHELHAQRRRRDRIHVDNALKQIGSSLCADELVIHRCATALLAVSMQHPAHALLWRLFMHIYLQRPAPEQSEIPPPIGPLFFSGIVKSRVLSQLKKRLQETVTFHHTQVQVFKSNDTSVVSTPTSSVVKDTTSSDIDELFPTLAIIDLTGVSNSQSECTLSDDSKGGDASVKESSGDRDIRNLLNYHIGVEKLFRDYLQWLEAGENINVHSYHADINHYLTEQALDAAWRASLGIISCSNTDPSPATPSPTTPPTPAPPSPSYSAHLSPATHAQRALAALMAVRDGVTRRYKIPALPQPLDDVYFTDSYLLYQTVDKYLDELKQLSEQWESDISRATQLDAQLWEYVRSLRVSRPLPPVRKACAKGCAPCTVRIPETEWCISAGAEQGLEDNRRSSRHAIRQLSRPRPYVARLASIITSLGGRIGREACALEVAERAYRAAAGTWRCAPAHDAVTALVSNIAQRFISVDSKTASEYLSRWMRGSCAQQRLCGVLVAPRALPAPAWPRLHAAVLALHADPHVAFSFLSKFDMSSWASCVDSSQRSEVLESLVKAALRIGPDPSPQYMVLLEILDKQSGAIVRKKELCAHTLRCAHASVKCRLPAHYCAHLPDVALTYADMMHFDQLGHLLRELGLIFWEARNSKDVNTAQYAHYAPYFTSTLYNLLKGFVALALSRSYEPERVAYYATSALHESWGAWIAPSPVAPLTPDNEDDVIAKYCDAVLMIMQAVTGRSGHVLRYVWQWAVIAALGLESKPLCATLLAHLARLPWNQPWFHVECLLVVPKVTEMGTSLIQSWCSNVMRYITAEDWLNGALDEHVPAHLVSVLKILTDKQMVLPDEALEEACKLPWHRLPNIAVEEAFETYFMDFYSSTLPYHEQPHFRVMLSVCMLVVSDQRVVARGPQAVERRARCLSQWVRAALVPALRAHVDHYTRYQLHVLALLAPHLENCYGELEALIGRALAIMSIEPAAGIALPVWEQWMQTCSPRTRRACVSAVACLTTIEYFAALADAVAKGVMNEKEGANWQDISSRWQQCSWADSGALVLRKRLHAAYALLHARAHSPASLRQVFRSLVNTDVDFTENQIIISLWICAACRIAVQCTSSSSSSTGDAIVEEAGEAREAGEAGEEAERRECAEAARALLLRWAEQKRSLLQLVSLQTTHCPTAQHRLLCRLALCIISPLDSTARSYETACASAGLSPDAAAWGRARCPRALPRLAARLHPAHDRYFALELAIMPEAI